MNEIFIAGCCMLLAILILTMLKRRASKRFVLVETGEQSSSWNSTVDNNIIVNSPENFSQQLNSMNIGASASVNSSQTEKSNEPEVRTRNPALLSIQPTSGSLK